MLGFVVGFEGCGGCAGFSDRVEEDCEGHGFFGIWLVGWRCSDVAVGGFCVRFR